MKNSFILLFSAIISIWSTFTVSAEQTTTDLVASEGAWCWFADPRALHYENEAGTINATWIGYIDVHGNIKASQYDFTTGRRNEVLVRSFFQPDDHNNPTFLVLPDERVLIIYSRHTDEPAFYYRVSRRPGDITDLGDEKKITTANNTTYPSPFILSDDPDHFYLCWRGIGWHPTIAKFSLPDSNDNVNVEWGPYQIVQSTGARPYAKYYSNGKDKIFFTYTTGHPDNEQPNWVYCNVVNINATKNASTGKVTSNPILEDVKGNYLSTIQNGTFNVNKTDSYKNQYPLTVVDAPSDQRDWVWQIATDTNGNPVIAMVRINGGKSSHIYYYAKWNGSAWNVSRLADAGGRFHSSNTEYCYSAGLALNPVNTSELILSLPTQGDNGNVYELWKYNVNSNGSITSRTQLTFNSDKNNVRPYIIPGAENSPLKYAWMNGDYYYWIVSSGYPLGYPTSIMCDYEYPLPENVSAAILTEDFNGESVTASTSKKFNLPAGNWTFSLAFGLDNSTYSGTILSADNFKYSVEKTSTFPSLELNGKKWESSNALLTSDNWAYHSTGTSGDKWPTYFETVTITMSYDGNNITVYRNGVIDQVVPASNLKLSNLSIGGFEGKLNYLRVYNEALDQDIIRAELAADRFSTISLPETTNTDLILPASLDGELIEWSSDHTAIIDNKGTFKAPATETVVTLTARCGTTVREYKVIAEPRNLSKNILAEYYFETPDIIKESNTVRVRDYSSRDNHLYVYGNAQIDGSLNLTSNTATNFNTNGYAVIPEGILDGLRSYTVSFDATIQTVTNQPRFYDFGVNSGNSMFLRTSVFSAGMKYAGGTTILIDVNKSINDGRQHSYAVTYDARSGVTSVYVDGELAASNNTIKSEPYMLLEAGKDNRNYIGRTQWWDSGVKNDNPDFCGKIDNFKLFNTALSKDELKGSATVIDAIDSNIDVCSPVYTITGVKVIDRPTAEDIRSLAPGIYILAGKKFVVK